MPDARSLQEAAVEAVAADVKLLATALVAEQNADGNGGADAAAASSSPSSGRSSGSGSGSFESFQGQDASTSSGDEEQGEADAAVQAATAAAQAAGNVPMQEPPKDRPVRVYADGIFDLFHFGHAKALQQAKLSDALTRKYKGKTVMTEQERYESLRHCKWVDEVVEDAPWVITQEFLDEHQIDFVCHDALPYADASGTCNDVYGWVKAAGKFKETHRTDGVSTSDLIMRIVRDYNEYVLRNLSRGYNRKDLNVSFVKEKQLKVRGGIRKMRQKLKEQQEKMGKQLESVVQNVMLKSRDIQQEWQSNTDKWMNGFIGVFEKRFETAERVMKRKLSEILLADQNKKRLQRKRGSEAKRKGEAAALLAAAQ
eukprot:jgi/Chlat1/2590/Chrsp178S02494